MKFKDKLEQDYLQELNDRMLDDMEEVMMELSDSVVVTADFCNVEPDGQCSHGYSSPLLLLGLI
tara:strand:+ start:4353 stop:4544 length:192 start_codon:yes stop_codon:yes gene_type:complete